MGAKIYIKTESSKDDILNLVKLAVEGETARMELSLEMANKRLQSFEKKYKVSSEDFISNWAAEDLEGGDEEYVSWAGEYQLKQRLEEKLKKLQELEYENSGLLRSN